MTLIEILESRDEALNVHQVAELLGVSDKHIYELVADGRLPAFRVGKAIRFDPQDVADWLRQKKPPQGLRSLREEEKDKSSTSNQTKEENGASAKLWRQKTTSLEAALVGDSSSASKSTEIC